ncbi:putative protein {ECO:0000313/EMBL:AAB86284,1} [Methanothermobacter wolfeii]|nr:putative protein {ECO:0000313/EMBL:AAB86284,1} [Methanothermobacter wolfeii]
MIYHVKGGSYILSRNEALELQDKLVIIYKAMQQMKSFEKFFGSYEGQKNEFIQELMKHEGINDLLRESILELEKIIRLDDPAAEEYRSLFDYILNRESVEFKCMRYGIKGPEDIGLRDIEAVISRVK